METMEICCETPTLPAGMTTGYGMFGGYVATCANCSYVCAYWECACELAHECN